ncbi:Auxin-responsive protein IAA8 [Hibiscus syriacus]|uniref:Auxin-responsive protein n=1 Tax=Hibiscus syriacus TaxID=106335 RepID=A0A6A3BHU3_HIBSY|nr:Auxin-responsive protein IAA8 [Hibiscus syriacus]
MSPPLLGVEEEVQSNVSSPSVDCGLGLKEHNYLGLSDCSSVDSSGVSSLPENNKNNLNLKATEFRLGLPETNPLRQKQSFACRIQENLMRSRCFIYFLPKMESAHHHRKMLLLETNGVSLTPWTGSLRSPGVQASVEKDEPADVLQKQPYSTSGINPKQTDISNNKSSAPAAKAQVVGWPPVRSFRAKTLATSSKNNDEVDGKPGPAALFVKVSMDGAPYLRKVDLRTYSTYRELSYALEKMFSCFTLGQCGSHGAAGKEILSQSKLKDLLHGSEYVLTYKDKDGDWMLVGTFLGRCLLKHARG